MNDQTCCFTGHRNIPVEDRAALEQRLEEEIINLIHQGVRYFGAGGALGFDTMAALAVLRLRPEYPWVRFILVLPCIAQTDGWAEVNKKIYNQILRQADKVVYITKQYSLGCMQSRNRHLVDSSSVCVCYLARPEGGTAYTVKYAEQNGLRVINLALPPSHTPPPPA
jgi:uncharacterized phage-like protein YoqJ